MGLLSEIADIVGQQNTLSGLQKWQQQGGVAADPTFSGLAQLAPRAYEQMAPSIIQRQMQMQMLGIPQPTAAPPAQSAQPQQSALAQLIGSSGDANPNAPIPQGLPQMQSAMPQVGQQPVQAPPQIPQGSNLAMYQKAFALGNGNIEQGMKVLQAQRALAVPAGAGAPPEGFMYDPNNPGSLMKIPGSITKGQQETDNNFAQNWQTYNNEGGAQRTTNAINVVDQTLQQLNSGQITTGRLRDRLAMEHGEPTTIGQIFDAPVLVARNQISSAILPQAKALFGSRVTNFDAQSLVNSQGLDPMASTQTNIEKLQRLRDSLVSAQADLQSSGQYFSQHGTLAGYQKDNSQQQYAPASAPQQSALAQVAPQQQNNNETLQALLAEKARRMGSQ